MAPARITGRFRGLAVTLTMVLAACSPAVPSGGTRAAGAGADPGARLYDGNCASCHQQDGRGIPNVYPSLAGSPVVLGDPAVIARWIVLGERPPSWPTGRYPTAMPRFGWMNAADVAALTTYLRSSFGNHAPPVSAQAIGPAIEEH
jgi:mono/diheme cytochrome c family protein